MEFVQERTNANKKVLKPIPEIKVGEEIKVNTFEAYAERKGLKIVKGKVHAITEHVLTINTGNYKVSFPLIDFRTGKASIV